MCALPSTRPAALATAVAGALPAARLAALIGLSSLAGLAGLGIHSTASAANSYFVNTTGDPGPPGTLSLRQAVVLASIDVDSLTEIRFDAGLTGSTITLSQGAIAIEQPMSILGTTTPLTIDGQDAGRIFEVTDAQVTISGLTLTHGHSTGCGGAIYHKGGSSRILTLRYLTVIGNSAQSGGGICSIGANSRVQVRRSRISGNAAAYGGGLYVGQDAEYALINRSTISGNTATSAGGGAFIGGVQKLDVSYSLIARNTVPAPSQYSYSSQGGGMIVSGIGNGGFRIGASTITANYSWASGSALRILDVASGDRTRLINATIVGNSAAIGGGAVNAAGTPTIVSAIVANNPGGDLAGTFAASYSLIKDPTNSQLSGDHNLIGSDPQLDPLADRGGPTFSMLPAPASPVINKGHDLTVVGELNRDQRGNVFFLTRDIGATERMSPEDILFRDTFEGF